MIKIREIKTKNDLINSHKLIKDSFKTVAEDFGLTIKNCPANPAFMKFSQLMEMKEKGNIMFGLFLEEKQVGFIAIEYAGKKTYYMERLSVLPEFRHNGYGRVLMGFTFDYADKNGGKRFQ